VAVALIMPVFCYRHFVQDKGVFPASMYDTREEPADPDAGDTERAAGVAVERSGPPVKRAGILPYVTLVGGAATVVVGQLLAAAAH
jgi:hypothetical protein